LVQFIHIQVGSKIIGVGISDYAKWRDIHWYCRQDVLIVWLRYIYIVCREIDLYIDGANLIEIYAISSIEEIRGRFCVRRFTKSKDVINCRGIYYKIACRMSNQEFTGYTTVSYCIRCAHCCFDCAYKLGYCVISWLYVGCSRGVPNETENECIVEIADGVETVRDVGGLE
jgi:hypothetical protein